MATEAPVVAAEASLMAAEASLMAAEAPEVAGEGRLSRSAVGYVGPMSSIADVAVERWAHERARAVHKRSNWCSKLSAAWS